jgi:hypothetical protein
MDNWAFYPITPSTVISIGGEGQTIHIPAHSRHHHDFAGKTTCILSIYSETSLLKCIYLYVSFRYHQPIHGTLQISSMCCSHDQGQSQAHICSQLLSASKPRLSLSKRHFQSNHWCLSILDYLFCLSNEDERAEGKGDEGKEREEGKGKGAKG